MILPFSTQLNGKETFFVEKISKSIKSILFKKREGFPHECVPSNFNFIEYCHCHPKLHTIRDDKTNRWKVGNKIDFYINVRQKNMFRFAPVLPVVSVQEVFMTYAFNDVIQISIDGKELFSYTERLEFAINDGFDNWEDFFNFFYPRIKESKEHFYKGKLIHWTNLKY